MGRYTCRQWHQSLEGCMGIQVGRSLGGQHVSRAPATSARALAACTQPPAGLPGPGPQELTPPPGSAGRAPKPGGLAPQRSQL